VSKKAWKIAAGLGTILTSAAFAFQGTAPNLAFVSGRTTGSAELLAALPGQVVAAGSALGNATPDEHHAPVLVPALGNSAIQVAAGGNFGVALQADGTVWTWGVNDVGQLGDGTFISRPVPQKIPNLSGITQISAGLGHVLALAADGAVWAWGANGEGQAGVIYPYAIASPTKVSGLSGISITQVSAGDEFSLALGPNGTVLGWGNNYVSQLGSGGTFKNTYLPVKARNLSGIIQVAAGAKHVLALRGDGSVWIWGADGHVVQQVPRWVADLPPNVSQVAAGDGDSFAVSGDQTGSWVWAWGLNKEGRLGDGTTTDRVAPVQLFLPDVYQIVAAGGSTAIVRIDGTVWAWGENHSGELGIGSNQLFVATPTRAVGPTSATYVSMGHGLSLAIGVAQPRVSAIDRTDPATSFLSTSVSAEGGAAPYTWTIGNLPPGLSVDSSGGIISGIPTTPGAYYVTATATDDGGHSGSASFWWTISPQIVTVPKVTGLAEADAIAAMRSVGLLLGPIALDNGCFDRQGIVLSQNPLPGPFSLVAGASFSLTVSSGRNRMGKPCLFQ
jgi:alpha-tubulin suppressor-like RCC1 family protein